MNLDLEVKSGIYRHFADSASRPDPQDLAAILAMPVDEILAAYSRLRSQRILVLEEDGYAIRMAPPFSGVPTPHLVEAAGKSYYANCAWDALGIPAALHQPAVIHSSCANSGEAFRLPVSLEGPEHSSWLFHCAVPAAHWWDDIVFT